MTISQAAPSRRREAAVDVKDVFNGLNGPFPYFERNCSTMTAPVAPTRISAASLRESTDGEHVVLDVRSTAEFAGGSVHGARSAPLDRLQEVTADLDLAERDVVLVCRSGARAHRAAGILAESGARSLKVLDGGLEAYAAVPSTAAGDRSTPTDRRGDGAAAGWSTPASEAGWGMERQVRLVAGSIVAGSVLASIWRPRARFVAGGIGAGLTFAALSNSCAMGAALGRLPFNRPRAARS